MLPSERPPCTDHFPIATTIDIHPHSTIDKPRYNWRAVDWPVTLAALAVALSKLAIPHNLRGVEEYEAVLDAFDDAVNGVIEKHVPVCTPSPYMKRWWTLELAQKRTEIRKLALKVFNLAQHHNFNHPLHEEH